MCSNFGYCVQRPCVLHPVCTAMVSKKLGAVEKKILGHIEAQHGGSGDLELEDAVDPCDFLTRRFAGAPADLAAIITAVMKRLEHLDGTWTGRRSDPVSHMPLQPAPGSTVDMWVSVTHLGFTVDTSVKGKSKAIRILDCVEDFLAEPFDSLRGPLSVMAPWGPVHHQLEPFSVRHRVGFARSLTCHLILVAVSDLKLSDTELQSIQRLLQPLFVVKARGPPTIHQHRPTTTTPPSPQPKSPPPPPPQPPPPRCWCIVASPLEAVWEGAASVKEEVTKTIKSKMQLSEIKRLDPIQCAHAWASRAKEEGVQYDTVIDTYLQEYRDEATSTQSISDLEEKVIKIIPAQTDACQAKLAYHWQNFKVAESGAPLRFITNDPWLHGTKPRDGSNALWVQIQAITPEKRQCCVQRRIGIFVKNIKDAQRLRKKVNLKVLANGFRDQKGDEVAYEIAATFCHFARDFQRILTPGKWTDCLQRFFRGSLDAELAEKVAHKDPKLTVESFRFLELFGAKLQTVSSVAQAAQEEAASLLQKERSDMEWVVRKLSSEVAAWNAYKELVRKWLCTTSLERNAKVTEIERKNDLLIEKELDLRCPCTEVPTGEFLGVHLQSAVQAWAEAHEAAMSDVTQVYWIDFTIPGYNFNRSALHALSKLAEGMAANPERTVGIILAPNTGPYGNEYSAEGVRASVGSVKDLLEDSSLKARWLDFDLVFDPATIPKQCKRAGKHLGWIVVSEAMSDGNMRALATKSDLWVRQTVCGIPFTHYKEYVNPLGFGRGNVNPNKDFSQSQKRKQWLTGWKVAKSVLDALWSGMKLEQGSVAAVHVLYGYDCSIVEQALRSSSSVPCQMVCQVIWADLDSDMFTVQPNVKIAKWLKASNKRVMKQLLMDKLFFLSDWTRPDTVGPSEAPRPTYQESDFKIICPVASGHLPMRKEWINMMENKYVTQSIKDEVAELFKTHNATHNPSGKPHEAAGVKRPASEAGLPPGPGARGIELPQQEGAPKNEAELAQIDGNGPLSKLQCMGQTLYFTASGHLWVWGEKDDVLSAGLCLALIYGNFCINQDVEKATKEAAKKDGKIWMWKVTSEEHSGVYLSDKLVNGEPFPKDCVRTLKEFVSHLASAGIIDPHMECHELKTSYDKNPDGEVIGATTTVNNLVPCCFKVLKRPASCKAEYDNLGSTLLHGMGHADWDMTTGVHKQGLVCLKDRMSYEETAQMTGIAPVKIGVCLVKAIRVQQNTLRQLA